MSLPSRGLCHSVYLLIYSARLHPASKESWIAIARRTPTFMAGALAIDEAADHLLKLNLAIDTGYKIEIDEQLEATDNEASNLTLTQIARILLHKCPPQWINTALNNGTVLSEFIPTEDEQTLAWLEDLRDPLLIDLEGQDDDSDKFRSWLGDIGESIVFESEKNNERKPIQVSRISDSFGFDIESRDTSGVRCIEVKTTLETKANRFFISKNEVEKATLLRKQWNLVQITLCQTAIIDKIITKDHIINARTLTAKEIISFSPKNSDTGTWIESAIITPPPHTWESYELSISPEWSAPGYQQSAEIS